ncbi:GNAT family N-acetyltransferase [Ralstonia insidiosa]|uniref:GNAT family N-acetyltransferase n=1 Tax=Ralstonia insidiosa TaxID=190721 RepID=UPI001BB0633D|nr:GNAT family N-acetyltransferase [Ralstonia insidiosa]
MNTPLNERYPRNVQCADTAYEIVPMKPEDGAAMSAFIATLPPHDLLFLDKDVTHPKVIAAWMAALDSGHVHSLVARRSGTVVGCTAIVTADLTWSRHVGEMRVLVSPSERSKGLGRELVQECFATALGLGLEKLCVRMTVDQRAAIAAFEGIGFRAEALLRNQVRDRDGNNHDLVILGHEVVEVQSRLSVFGITDAFAGD